MRLFKACFLLSYALRDVLSASSNAGISVDVDLSSYFNNNGVSASPGSANFDGNNGSYPLNQLPTGILPYRGINFTLPPWGSSSPNNIVAQGQNISLNTARFQTLHLLGAGDGGSIYTNNISVTYSDGTIVTQPILIPGWKDSRGLVVSNYTYTANGIDGNTSHIHYFQIPLNAGKALSSLTLPTGTVSGTRLHVFGISLFSSASLSTPSSGNPGPALTFQYVRSRNQWYNDSALPISFMKVLDDSTAGSVVHVVEVGINNLPFDFGLSSWLIGEHTVEISSPHLQTVYAGALNRLRAGDQARVKVGVVNKEGAARGTTTQAVAIVKDATGKVVATSPSFEIIAGIPEYDNSLASLAQHEAPKWFEDAKVIFNSIFVHWGVYSIPAFAPSGKWYWWQSHEPNNTNSPTWVHHKETYGEDFLYDQFIPMFNPTAANWSADSFTDLFAESGAKYFVLVTKHHDGVALFDAGNTTNRTTVALGPKHDFIKEIFESAAARHPDLVPATYFSNAEWYNPAWARYGFSSWPGGLAHNAYNWSKIEPYTGYVEVDDYIQDIQKPQMQILMDTYETNVLWCDTGPGAITNVTELMAGWYNRKFLEGKNVAIDDRCATWAYINYTNTTVAIRRLVDIVSKNGNWLLDIGPTGNGSVVEPEVTTLRGLGAWLAKAGKSIYATDYWFIGPQESSNIRFTTTPLAFYITTISSPSPSFTVNSPVPLLAHDTITLLGGSGQALNFTIEGETGAVTIQVPATEAEKVSDAWAFEVLY
ncbi:glycoside hydrolase [Gautieria morchelliformis]|nr:glycoside hydrolase [Gautieria morchelliformis]